MNKRTYPLILIDRSKHSTYPYDFVVVLDNDTPFISKVRYVKDEDIYNQFISRTPVYNDHETPTYASYRLKSGGVILTIERFITDNIEFNNKKNKRIEALLKRAIGKYIHGERVVSMRGDTGIDNQILLMEATIDRAKANYADLVARSSAPDEAMQAIDIAIATLDTLKKVRDNK